MLRRAQIARSGFKAKSAPHGRLSNGTGAYREKTETGLQPQIRRSAGLNRRGPKVKAWDIGRARLKRRFAAKGIITCQVRFPGCWFDNALSFAHPAKRRNLRAGELGIAALVCTPCHDQLEVMPPEQMRSIVEASYRSIL